jgi:hypothetical protein
VWFVKRDPKADADVPVADGALLDDQAHESLSTFEVKGW